MNGQAERHQCHGGLLVEHWSNQSSEPCMGPTMTESPATTVAQSVSRSAAVPPGRRSTCSSAARTRSTAWSTSSPRTASWRSSAPRAAASPRWSTAGCARRCTAATWPAPVRPGAWRSSGPASDPIGALARALAAPGVLFDKPMTGAVLGRGAGRDDAAPGQPRADRHRRAGRPADRHTSCSWSSTSSRSCSASARWCAARSRDASAPPRTPRPSSSCCSRRAQTEVPIYVVLTMRSDFLGDCAQFHGLPEAINEGQYLVPRLTRDEMPRRDRRPGRRGRRRRSARCW